MAIYGSQNRMVRQYVEVDAHHFVDCTILPTMVYWSDGRRWEATVLGHPLRERRKTHGFAIKYDILVGRARRALWRDEHGWFFEIPEGKAAGALDPRACDIPC